MEKITGESENFIDRELFYNIQSKLNQYEQDEKLWSQYPNIQQYLITKDPKFFDILQIYYSLIYI